MTEIRAADWHAATVILRALAQVPRDQQLDTLALAVKIYIENPEYIQLLLNPPCAEKRHA